MLFRVKIRLCDEDRLLINRLASALDRNTAACRAVADRLMRPAAPAPVVVAEARKPTSYVFPNR